MYDRGTLSLGGVCTPALGVFNFSEPPADRVLEGEVGWGFGRVVVTGSGGRRSRMVMGIAGGSGGGHCRRLWGFLGAWLAWV